MKEGRAKPTINSFSLQRPLTIRDKYPPITPETILSYEISKDSHILGRGFLRKGAATLLTGQTGIGKSVLVLQIACHIVAGRSIFGIEVPCSRRVLLLNSQNDMETLQRDLKAIMKHSGLTVDQLGGLSVRYLPGIPLVEFLEVLIDALEKDKPELVIIDPFQDFLGAVDLNDSKAFFMWRDTIAEIMKHYNFGLLLTPHTPKPRKRESLTDREMVYMAVGTSAIANWCRCASELLHSNVNPEIYYLHFSKNAERTGLRTSDGRIIRQIMLRHASTEDEPYWLHEQQVKDVIGSAESLVLKFFNNHPDATIREAAEILKLSKSLISKYYKKWKQEIAEPF